MALDLAYRLPDQSSPNAEVRMNPEYTQNFFDVSAKVASITGAAACCACHCARAGAGRRAHRPAGPHLTNAEQVAAEINALAAKPRAYACDYLTAKALKMWPNRAGRFWSG